MFNRRFKYRTIAWATVALYVAWSTGGHFLHYWSHRLAAASAPSVGFDEVASCCCGHHAEPTALPPYRADQTASPASDRVALRATVGADSPFTCRDANCRFWQTLTQSQSKIQPLTVWHAELPQPILRPFQTVESRVLDLSVPSPRGPPAA